MNKHSKRSWFQAGLVVGLVALAPIAAADRSKHVEAKATVKAPVAELSLDAIVGKHLAALGGADLLRATKALSYTSTGEKAGKKFTKTVHFARPGKMRVDFQMADEPLASKGFDGKVAWKKKAGEAAIALGAEDTAAMKLHANFDEPLLDYAKRGDTVKLLGTSEVGGKPAYELEVTAAGEIERVFIDAATFLPVQRAWTIKKDGKPVTTTMKMGDYRVVQGRMVNHSVAFEMEGTVTTGAIAQVVFDKPPADSVFAMPKK